MKLVLIAWIVDAEGSVAYGLHSACAADGVDRFAVRLATEHWIEAESVVLSVLCAEDEIHLLCRTRIVA